MITKTGHFNLFPILNFAAGNPVIPYIKDRQSQAEYSKLIKATIADVPEQPGWYWWGRFNDMGWWETVYLGKAGKQKTSSLHTRLYDELREECIAFWAEIYGSEPMLKQHKPITDKYGTAPTRALRKRGSQIVIWVAVEDEISEEEIKRQEDLLIKLYRPTHNAARWNQSAPHDETTQLIEQVVEAELQRLITPT